MGDHLPKQPDRGQSVGAKGGAEAEVGNAGGDEGFQPLDHVVGGADNADAQHTVIDQRDGFGFIAFDHHGMFDGTELLLGQPQPFQNERAEGVTVVGDFVGQDMTRRGAIIGQRHPDTGGKIERGERRRAVSQTSGDIGLYSKVMLWWKEQRQNAVGQRPR